MRYESRSRQPATPQERSAAGDHGEFWVSTDQQETACVLSLFGELDTASAPHLERQLKRLQWAGAAAIVVDLSGLDFIDSSGLHVLIRAHHRTRDGQLTLLRGPRRVHRVFELTGTDDLLRFVD